MKTNKQTKLSLCTVWEVTGNFDSKLDFDACAILINKKQTNKQTAKNERNKEGKKNEHTIPCSVIFSSS